MKHNPLPDELKMVKTDSTLLTRKLVVGEKARTRKLNSNILSEKLKRTVRLSFKMCCNVCTEGSFFIETAPLKEKQRAKTYNQLLASVLEVKYISQRQIHK